MKKLVLIITIVIVLVLSGCTPKNENILYIYNWGDYIDDSLIETFTEETGIEVIYEEFDTNESMYTKIKNGGTDYDIIIPSDYMIEKMINEDMLETIDTSSLQNYKNIDEKYKNLDYDSENAYSVPYFWGTCGILYNTKLVDEPVDSWSILFDEKYKGKVFMLDSQRDTLMIALKLLGYSMNTRDASELEAAKQLLLEQKPNVLSYVVDNGKEIMVQGGAALMPTWNGEAIALSDENPDLAFGLPKEGTNIWFDAMAIPKGAKHKEAALKFIDFMCDAEHAKINTEYVGYSTPNKVAFDLLDDALKQNEAAYPKIENLKNSEIFEYLGEDLDIYNQVWKEIKIQ